MVCHREQETKVMVAPEGILLESLMGGRQREYLEIRSERYLLFRDRTYQSIRGDSE